MQVKITKRNGGAGDNCIEPDGFLVVIGSKRAVCSYKFGRAVFTSLIVPESIEIEVSNRLPILKPMDMAEVKKIVNGDNTYIARDQTGFPVIDLASVVDIDNYVVDTSGPIQKVKHG